MRYEDFIVCIKAGVSSLLGEDVSVDVHRVRKNNDIELDGLLIHSKESCVAPTIYLNGFYEEFRRGKEIPEIVDAIYEIYKKSRLTEEIDLSDYTEYENIKDGLACKLINRERNRELLKTVPYLAFLNLALVVYYRVEHPVMGVGTILVRDEHLDAWNISEEELFFEARRNMRSFMPERFENVANILSRDPEIELPEEDIPMYVLTNSDCCFGAAYMIFDSILAEIGEILHDDFWIIPSSVHECIIIPKHVFLLPEDIASMIYQVNCENISEEEYLSDNLYVYQRDLHKLQIAETRIA